MNLPNTNIDPNKPFSAKLFGAVPLGDQRVRFRIWAPNAAQVVLELYADDDSPVTREVQLTKQPGGFHVAEVDQCSAGCQYAYRIDGGPPRPDPASRLQPDGVHGPSQVVDPAFDWTDDDWPGVPRDELVIYELHVGCFTEQGTFLSAIDRLDELVDLGVTAVEVMPLAESAGRWNWGYDGVNLFAPMHHFGTPRDFRAFVDAAHSRGLAVIVDVVFNHLGPEGNYLGEIGPYLSDRHHTPWGSAPNFDDPDHAAAVREFFIAATMIWFDEYHVDALRVDAIHCMKDDREPHIAAEMADAVNQWSKQTGRRALMIAESNVYDPNMLEPLSDGGIGFDAEWCDDFLHSIFAVVRPGEQLCHREYKFSDLAQVTQTGFIYEGTIRKDRVRRPVGPRVDTHGLIYSIQNHDFIGNHPLGKRLHQLTSLETQKAAAALMLLSPAIPMLFMGEEFACENAFQFFVDFGDAQLQQSVVRGRQDEYPQHDWSNGVLPTDPKAFKSSKIGEITNTDMRNWYRDLIVWRKKLRACGLLCDANVVGSASIDDNTYRLSYSLNHAPANASPVAGSSANTLPGELNSAEVIVRLNPMLANASPIELQQAGNCVLDSIPDSGDYLHANHAKIYVW